MKTYDEMAHDALERISEQKCKQKKRRKTITGITVSAVFCLLSVFGIAAWQSGWFAEPVLPPDASETTAAEITADNIAVTEVTATEIPVSETGSEENETTEKERGNERPTEYVENVTGTTETTAAAPADNGNKGSVDTASDCAILRWNNKLNVSGALYYAMQADPSGTFSVTASYRPATAEITDFTYEGKTLSEWAVASEDARFTLQKMHELLKQGEELKLGTALYETGLPDGTKWDRRLYEDKVVCYGALLDKYIVNGEFLRDDLQKDIDAFDVNAAAAKYKLAYNAYLEVILPEILQDLSQSGISCERAPYSTNGIVVAVTPEQLENLPLPDPTCWSFDLASNATKDGVTDEAVVYNAGNAG